MSTEKVPQLEYVRTHTIKGTLVVKTGLRVGAGKESVEIGGIDNPIVKHPHSLDPYIPGSSLKGKLRTLLEWALGKIEDDGKVWGSGSSSRIEGGDEILRIFGATRDDWKEGPARALFRDLMLDEEWKRGVDERGLPLTEEKTEVAINRIEGKADSMGPRTMERIPAGARFRFEILFREFSVNGDGGRRDRECLNRLLEALRLLEQDALGGSGSRGYGKVEVERVEVDEVDVTTPFRKYSEFKPEKVYEFVQIA